jgi:C-terminal processing protease CtpA/Prc
MYTQQVEHPFEQEQLVAFEIYLENAFQQSIDAIVMYFAIDSDIKANDNETMFWGTFDHNIGYLNITTMEIAELGNSDNNIEQNKSILSDILDEVMQDFVGVNGIIIDVRYNSGGDDFVGQMIVSRFIEQSLHIYSKQARLGDGRTPLLQVFIEPEGAVQFLGPVAVMTSASTFNAAEIFAMSMRERAETILVGETTAGGLSNLLPRSLSHGAIVTLVNELFLTPDSQEFDGVGVPVDIQQDFFTSEQREQGIDLGLEQAMEWIRHL